MMSQQVQLHKLLLPDEGEAFQFFGLRFIQKVSRQDTNNGWVINQIISSTGDGAPLHSHPWTEGFYVLEGELEVQIDIQKAVATSGTLMFVPENVAHSFKACLPTQMLEIIPAAAEAFYREGAEQIPTLPPDPEVFQALCQKYHVQVY